MSLITEQCPQGWTESKALTLLQRETWRESVCGEKNMPCCGRGWSKECNKECAIGLCENAGGKWIPKDYKKYPYTCQIGS